MSSSGPASSSTASPTSPSSTPNSSSATPWDRTPVGGAVIFISIAVPIVLVWLWAYCVGRRRRRRQQMIIPVHRAPPRPPVIPARATTRRNSSKSTTVGRSSFAPRDCKVCLSSLPAPLFPSRPPTKSCAHQAQVCKTCLANHIDAKIQWMGTVAPLCPSCYHPMEFKDVRDFASKEVFERYDTLLTRKLLSAAPTFIWCKNPSCSSGQYFVPSSSANCDTSMVTCTDCGNKACFSHDMPWHEGMTCKQYDKRKDGKEQRKDAGRSKRTIERKTRACPKCGAPVEKNGGCNNMYCAPPGGCGHNFRWRSAKHSRVPKRPKILADAASMSL